VKPRRRRQLLDWHLYLGLLCAPYFVLYGVSSIAFNHHLHGDPVVTNWERPISAAPAGASKLDAAKANRDALGLGGETLPWTVRRAPDNALAFNVTRPGRKYEIAVSPNGELARVRETDRGWIGVVREMHGAVATTGIAWTRLWSVYTDASILALLFALASGLLLWCTKRKQRVLGVATMTTGSLIWLGIWSWLW
jgi:hypothetical protein